MNTETVELHVVDKLEEFFVLLFCLSRESCDQRGAQCDIRHLASQEINFVDQLLFGGSATHAAQDLIVGMLNRQIQVVTDFQLFLHRLNEFRIDVLRIAVQNPDPVELLNFAELF